MLPSWNTSLIVCNGQMYTLLSTRYYYNLLFSTLISLFSLLNGHSQLLFVCVWDPTQCYIEVTKISTPKTCKDFQWWRKISPAIRCTKMHKYGTFTWAERDKLLCDDLQRRLMFYLTMIMNTVLVKSPWLCSCIELSGTMAHRPTINTYRACSSWPSTLCFFTTVCMSGAVLKSNFTEWSFLSPVEWQLIWYSCDSY